MQMPTLVSLRRAARSSRGFTLIELMIVVAIVAVLARIALPAYFDSIRKSRRSDAIAAIAQVQQAQERYRANQTSFGTHYIVTSGNLTGVGISTDANAATTYNTAAGYYKLEQMSGVSSIAYTIQATALASQANDTNCKLMCLTMNAGNVTYSSGASACNNSVSLNNQCWKR